MGREEFSAYVMLAMYGLMFVGAIKVFGIRRVFRFLFAIVFIGVWVAMGTLRGLTARRY